MIEKINVMDICRDHWRTLRDYGARNVSWRDLLLFYGFPLGAGVGTAIAKATLPVGAIVILVTTFAIFTGLLLNLLLITHGSIQKTGSDHVKRKLLVEVYANLSYSIFVATATLGILIVAGWIVATALGPLWAAATTFLVLHFFLTLLMILKRVHALMRDEFSS